MTALNWEKDRARTLPKEYSFDDLPSAGSYWDQVRYGVRPSRQRISSRSSSSEAQTIGQVRSRSYDFQQLGIYLAHLLHPDFKRKLQCQKLEMVQIVRKLVMRCETWGQRINTSEKNLLNKAQESIKIYTH